MTSINNKLRDIGPCLTTDLIKSFVEEGLSEVAARKRVSRALDGIKRLAGLRFEKNARFVYLEHQYGTREYWTGLEKAFYNSGKSYWMSLVNLRARGGICLRSEFPIVCGAPIKRTRQLSPDIILQRLSEIYALKILPKNDNSEERICLNFYSSIILKENEIAAIRLAENIGLMAIREWAKRIGFGSYNKFKVRGEKELPIVSSIAWDLTAPSYFRPLLSIKGGKANPGFFVCDINFYGPISKEVVEVFVRKHDMASSPLNVGGIIGFLVGDTFQQDAFDFAKQKGIIPVTIENLLGSEISKALSALIKLLSDLGNSASVDSRKIELVLGSLSKIEGASTNLRAAMFELVVGKMVKEIEGGFLICGEKREDPISHRKVEIDIQLNKSPAKDYLVIECKSKIPGARVDLPEVQKWLNDRVPLIFNILTNNGSYLEKEYRFEFWTNGPINDDAIEWLERQVSPSEHYTFAWKDGNAVKEYSLKCKDTSIRKILREHYFNHPLSKIAREKRIPKIA